MKRLRIAEQIVEGSESRKLTFTRKYLAYWRMSRDGLKTTEHLHIRVFGLQLSRSKWIGASSNLQLYRKSLLQPRVPVRQCPASTCNSHSFPRSQTPRKTINPTGLLPLHSHIRTHSFSADMSDQFREIAEIPRDFLKVTEVPRLLYSLLLHL